MTQEEKAKAYDEAIERAKQYLGAAYPIADANLVKEIFPELAESEDEKINAAIVYEDFNGGDGFLQNQSCIPK